MAKASTGTKILKQENFLFISAIICFVILAFFTVWGQATLTKVNVEVETLKNEIAKQEETNEVLVMKRDELSSYDKIDAVAKAEGLTYNNSNIKTVD